jgi:hypothetical protein
MKNIIKRILREQRQFDSVYLKKVSSRLETPYFYNMEEQFGVSDHNDQEEVLRFIYGNDISISNRGIRDSKNNLIYNEFTEGDWEKSEYDSNNKLIYWENGDGYWEKREYNYEGQLIFSEDECGFWEKHEYDKNGKEIYYENSDGRIVIYSNR